MDIQKVNAQDAEALLSIYAPYVLETAVSFEHTVLEVEDFRQRIEEISRRLPYLKAVEEGVILGYAYAAPFRKQRAYDHCVELTVYLRQDARGRGIGRLLYEALESTLRDMCIRNLYACIAVPREESPRLSSDSPRFHEKMGYRLVGTFRDSGYKFGQCYDMVWMEKRLGSPPTGEWTVRFGDWKLP